jgi:hypothetical protein
VQRYEVTAPIRAISGASGCTSRSTTSPSRPSLVLHPARDAEPQEQRPPDEIAAAIEKELDREPDELDSHPSPRQRIEWAHRLAVVREPRPDDDAKVWDLFPEPESIERAMTAVVRDQVRIDRGIVSSDKEADDPATDAAD